MEIDWVRLRLLFPLIMFRRDAFDGLPLADVFGDDSAGCDQRFIADIDFRQNDRPRPNPYSVSNLRSNNIAFIISRGAHQIIICGRHAAADKDPFADFHISGEPGVILDFGSIADQGRVIHRDIPADDDARADSAFLPDRRAVADQGLRADFDVVINNRVGTDDAAVADDDMRFEIHRARHSADAARRFTDIGAGENLHIISDLDSLLNNDERVNNDIIAHCRSATNDSVLTNDYVFSDLFALDDRKWTDHKLAA